MIIVLLLLGGIVWWLFATRRSAEQNARIFANEVANRVVINSDEKFLHVHLSPTGQAQYLRSMRDRLLEQLRAMGVPQQPLVVQGDVEFSSYFFDPRAIFRVPLIYPDASAHLELGISRGMTVWQIDTINLMWDRLPPTPTPTPIPSPTPSPTPEQKRKKR